MPAINRKLYKLNERSGPPPRRWARWGYRAALVVILAGFASPAPAADPENCLSCHRYRGLARIDGHDHVQLYYVDPGYYDRSLGPHARLACTDCHPRDEVEVIPHRPVSPVNCTTLCHLTDSVSTEKVFSHYPVSERLAGSVHTTEALSKSNQLIGSPLEAGQSQCLLCHDEPTFRRDTEQWISTEAPIARCEECHDESLQVDTTFMYWHVHARSRPSRSHAEIVRICGMCHADQRVMEEYDLSNAAASYLFSFHGKAMQLGNEETAGCLDCHAAQPTNVHHMLSQEVADSPTHFDNLSDTCRSPDCHPTAGAAVSTAAVHLDLSTGGGIEFFIGAIFILLVASTFGPSVFLQAMEMFHIVIGRHDPEQHRREKLAEKMLADPRGRESLKRFTVHQRLQHWFLFATFTALCLTGFPIKFADRPWAAWLIDTLGGLPLARAVHHWVGLLLIMGAVYHLVYAGITAIQSKRKTGKSWFRVIYDLPMIATWEDLKYLLHLLGYLFFIKKTRPRGGRFTLKEKFEYFGVFWGTVLLGLTGLLMWFNAWTTTVLPGRVLTFANLLHTFEAYLALLHVGVIHMIGVFFAPAVFPVSQAMFTGDTPEEEMAEAHAGMLEEAARKIGVETTGEVH